MRSDWTRVGLWSCALFALACGDDTANGDGELGDAAMAGDAIEVAGTWESSFGATEVISADSWDNGFVDNAIVEFDNDENVAILQVPEDAEHGPGTFDRVLWTDVENGAFYYCTVEFGLDSLAEAQSSSTSADAGDLEGEGCGGFSWTRLERVED